jgi:hypothetical protein
MRGRHRWLAGLALLLVACAAPPQGITPDVTPPTIASRSPAPNAMEVSVHAPIQVRFSEPLDPATIDATTVVLQHVGGSPVAVARTLSDAGRTLTVTPLAAVVAPSTLELALTDGVSDIAGNALAAEAWSWSLPVWRLLGGGAAVATRSTNAVDLTLFVLDAPDRPIVATHVEGAPYVRILRWNGDAWDALPPLVDHSEPVRLAALADDPPGGVVAAWYGPLVAGATDSEDLHVSRWNGVSWSLVGGGLLRPRRAEDAGMAPPPTALVVDASGAPTVAWREAARAPEVGHDLLASRWNGATWSRLGTTIESDGATFVWNLALALVDHAPIVSWSETIFPTTSASPIRAWDPVTASWTAIALSMGSAANAAQLVMKSDGTLTSVVDKNAGAIEIAYRTGGFWTVFGPPLPAMPATAATAPSPAAATTGELVVAWRETMASDSHLRVARLAADLGGWTDLALPVVPGGDARIVLGPRLLLDGDVPLLAFTVQHLAKDPVDGSFAVDTVVLRRNE